VERSKLSVIFCDIGLSYERQSWLNVLTRRESPGKSESGNLLGGHVFPCPAASDATGGKSLRSGRTAGDLPGCWCGENTVYCVGGGRRSIAAPRRRSANLRLQWRRWFIGGADAN